MAGTSDSTTNSDKLGTDTDKQLEGRVISPFGDAPRSGIDEVDKLIVLVVLVVSAWVVWVLVVFVVKELDELDEWDALVVVVDVVSVALVVVVTVAVSEMVGEEIVDIIAPVTPDADAEER